MATRKKTIEIDEEVFVRKEVRPVRVEAGATPYAIWNCPDAPDEKIRVNDGTVLRFRNGLLECRHANDDAAVTKANRYAGGKYLRADPDRFGDGIDDPFRYTHKGRTSRWYSQRAYERFVARHPNTD